MRIAATFRVSNNLSHLLLETRTTNSRANLKHTEQHTTKKNCKPQDYRGKIRHTI